MDTPNGALVRRCFRILSAKNIGLTITLADITEEAFRVLELIETERQEQDRSGEGTHGNFKGRAAKLSRMGDDGDNSAIGIAISNTHDQDGTSLRRHPEVE
jgi:hypothetical protein